MSQTDTAPATGQEPPPAPSEKDQAAAAIDAIRTGETSPSTPAPDGQPGEDAPAYTPSRRVRAAAKHLGRSETDIAKLTEDSARDLLDISRTIRAREKAADTETPGDEAPGSDGADEELSEESDFDELYAGYKKATTKNKELVAQLADKDKKSETDRQQRQKETARTEMDSWFTSPSAATFPEFGNAAEKGSVEWDARQELIDEVETRTQQYDERDIDKTHDEIIEESLRHLYPNRFVSGSGLKTKVARPSGTAKPPAEGQTPKEAAVAKMDEHLAIKGIKT